MALHFRFLSCYFLCCCILFILVAISLSQTQNISQDSSPIFWFERAGTHRAPRSLKGTRLTAHCSFSSHQAAGLAQAAQAALPGRSKLTEEGYRNPQFPHAVIFSLCYLGKPSWSPAPASYPLLINWSPISSLFSLLWFPHSTHSFADNRRQLLSQSTSTSNTPSHAKVRE